MRSKRRLPVILAVLTVVVYGIGNSPALAADVLQNGSLEESTGPAGWTLTQSITGLPGALISATEHLDIANQEFPADGLGLLLNGAAGNQVAYAGQNKMVNVTLAQTTATLSGAAGKTFTFTGHSHYQLSYSGNVDTLGVLTPLGDYNLDVTVNAADYTIWRDTMGVMDDGFDPPEDMRANGDNTDGLNLIDQADYDYWKARFGNAGHGAIASPTQTLMKVEFLNSSDTVLATHTLNLPKNRLLEDWQEHVLTTPAAPTGTVKARVSVAATDMVESALPAAGQDVWLDNFSLFQNGTFGGEKLKTLADGTFSGSLNAVGAPTHFEVVKTPQDNLQFSTASFANRTDMAGPVGMWLRSFNGGDVTISQTVAGTPGADYSYSAYARLQPGYIGLDPLHPEVVTAMTMEFLDASNVVIGAPVSLDIDTLTWATGTGNQGVWQLITLPTTMAPLGTVSVKISAGAINMANSGAGIIPQSAMFDDFSLIETLPGSGGLAAVPEPSSLLLVGIAMALLGAGRRRGR